MARKQKISAGCVNIRIHDQNRRDYSKLYRWILNRSSPQKVHGNTGIYISSDLAGFELGDAFGQGILSKFVDFDQYDKWANLNQRRAATQIEREQVTIPEGIRPGLKSFPFAFEFSSHLFFVQNYDSGNTLSLPSVKKYFDSVFSMQHFLNEFGAISVTILQSEAALDDIFGMDVLKELSIFIEMPNHDVWGLDNEEEVEQALTEEGASSFEARFKAGKGGSLTPSDRTRIHARVALNNGYVSAKGKQEGVSKTISTTKYPLIEAVKVDPERANPAQFFRDIIGKITQRMRRHDNAT
jgi:Domain of unknown function (DUF4747)